jgi:TolA-binding protein
MSIWKIGQDVSASEYFENTKKGYLYLTDGEGEDETVKTRRFFGFGSTHAANTMAGMCDLMSAEYASSVDEANSYLLEIDSSMDELNNLQESVKEQIAKLEKEIAELNKKKEDGTITEDEENELNSKQEELNSLTSSSNTQIGTQTADINTTIGKANEVVSTNKESIATDYGNTAVTKGDELASTEDKKKTFFRKIFGGWDKSKIREAGKKLAESGDNLLGNVTAGQSIRNEIDDKTKNFGKTSV